MAWLYILLLSGLSVFIGFPYFLDPVAAATFHETHWVAGIQQAVGFFLVGWLCSRLYERNRSRDPGQGTP
jgi:hypothetical protein